MFGKLRSILDAIPRYVVDYQERPRAVKEARWVDRITTDFSWSGNLYDFYRNVYAKLVRDIKIPFALKGDQRNEESNQTILALRMMSLLPEESVSYLKKRFGKNFESLSQTERVALTTSHAEKCINHARLKELTKEHASDLTKILHGLVEKGFLESDGKSTATFYYLPGEHPFEDSGVGEVFGLDIGGVTTRNRGPTTRNRGPTTRNRSPTIRRIAPNKTWLRLILLIGNALWSYRDQFAKVRELLVVKR